MSTALDEVELFRRASDRAAAQVRLSVAYVSLRATGDEGGTRLARRSLPLLRPDMSLREAAAGEGRPGCASRRLWAAPGGSCCAVRRTPARRRCCAGWRSRRPAGRSPASWPTGTV
ncbi:hypothetical protein ACGFZQ_19100 [Streptomyces sp. NPDC048254]|uniref:hypothetical protein n=1 Tax=Streptomyces sp. NPDC048254 TaxID=3365525 RepID=UPI00371C943B